MTTKKIININGQDWEIVTPDDIYLHLELSSKAGEHVSDWAWEHARRIGTRLSDGRQHWLPWAYKKFITEYIH